MRGQAPAAERKNVSDSPQDRDDIEMGADQQLGVVLFAQLGCQGPRKLLGGERELRVDAGLVATWVLSVPTALQVNSNEPMHIEGGAVVGEPLIAQSGRDAFGPEQGPVSRCALAKQRLTPSRSV